MRHSWLKKFGFGIAGIRYGVRTQLSFRIHIAFAFFVIAFCVAFQPKLLECAVLALTIGLVLTAELLNTAVEVVVDYISPEVQPAAKVMKDVAAGAVLISAVAALTVGICVMGPHLLNYIQRTASTT